MTIVVVVMVIVMVMVMVIVFVTSRNVFNVCQHPDKMHGSYFWRCLPCVTAKQTVSLLETYGSFESMSHMLVHTHTSTPMHIHTSTHAHYHHCMFIRSIDIHIFYSYVRTCTH